MIQNFIIHPIKRGIREPSNLPNNRAISLMSTVFANGPGDQVSVPGSNHSKDSKLVLDAALLNTQYYKVRIKDKVEKSKEWSCALPYTSV